MKELIAQCLTLSDEQLSKEIRFLIEKERRNLSGLLVHIGEFDKRKLYRADGYPSMFIYCTKALGYDESAAYRRITAARVSRVYPEILPMVQGGALTLTSILLLAPVLTQDNRMRLFKEVKGRTRREIETLVAGISPQPAREDYLARRPAPPPAWSGTVMPTPAGVESHPSPPHEDDPHALLQPISAETPSEWQAVMPLTLDRVRIGFDAAVLLMKLIERAREVLRHKYPAGRLEDVLRDALESFLERKDPQRTLALKPSVGPVYITESGPVMPRHLRDLAQGRYIPQAVKRTVWNRDDGRCAFRSEDGTVCGSRDSLEFDHIRPFALGGKSNVSYNIRLLCRMHNRLAAERAFLRPDAPGGLPVAPSEGESGEG